MKLSKVIARSFLMVIAVYGVVVVSAAVIHDFKKDWYTMKYTCTGYKCSYEKPSAEVQELVNWKELQEKNQARDKLLDDQRFDVEHSKSVQLVKEQLYGSL